MEHGWCGSVVELPPVNLVNQEVMVGFQLLPHSENRHVQFERFVVAAGENTHPVADGSLAVVVCTLALCSAESQERILQAVRRVLRPVSVSV
ncbi:Methyltransferase-like protein 7A [Myotis brandtii]|uniref:Methyltransferase-like protein 7A n=1 Tax=Myotis brandtii TaxID=109478 RepID=S7MYH0_MYOBR|nr:Methyltransferase-like protein 7A [Myotis brandtii]